MELKYKITVLAAAALLVYIAVAHSVLYSLLLGIPLLLLGGFQWFSSTNLSVEITVFLAKFFPASSQAVWDTQETPGLRWSAEFRKHWRVIYDEYLEFEAKYNYCPEMDDVYPNGSITNWDRKWPTVNLRCYGLDTRISQYFPKTMALVNASDSWLSHVMFSILKPSKFIPRHRGPYRGVFRYQLHLEIPEHKSVEDELYLCVWPGTSSADFWSPEQVPAGEPTFLSWREGSDFVFDDTCVHEVINFTKKRRIILFMDVERHDLAWWAKLVHRLFMGLAKFLPAVRSCAQVQDDFLERCKDDKTQQLTRFGAEAEQANESKKGTSADQVDFDVDATSPANSWMWYNTTPEILPFRKARVVIRNALKQKAKEEKQARAKAQGQADGQEAQ